ncbi:hypothetical protein AZI86_04395 [Bdellovibrio bacteriovorus]|uniref:Uncharacterized protein n=1 Tax=Bdellovibrio bacteriovorus TaxID=959 RepID=A0A150WP92_BDEBC|nr:hypothetical protein [Bdellovibrio bacteriovorus]KYG66302.1 hypothetical protein AZI86_04395 [Bdellovibrio bacteriovorus]
MKAIHALKSYLVFSSVISVVTMVSISASAYGTHCQNIFHASQGLIKDAADVGLTAQVVTAFRFDSRPPQVIKSEGFIGNKEKFSGSILAHSKPNSSGTSNYVSFTSDPNNRQIFNGGFIPVHEMRNQFPGEASRQRYLERFNPEYQAKLEKRRDELRKEESENEDVLGYGVDEKSLPPEQAAYATKFKSEYKMVLMTLRSIEGGPRDPIVFVTYEYRAKDVLGVNTEKIGITQEKEIVTEPVPAKNIDAVREVYVIFWGDAIGDVANLQKWKESFSVERIYRHLVGVDKDRMEIEFGDWKPL